MTRSMATTHAVVGAGIYLDPPLSNRLPLVTGPAGLCVVSRILDTDPEARITWFDPSFAGGRLQNYKQVPRYIRWLPYTRLSRRLSRLLHTPLPLSVSSCPHSNTKVSLFLEFARVSQSLSKIMQAEATPVATLMALDQDKVCTPAYIHAGWLGLPPPTRARHLRVPHVPDRRGLLGPDRDEKGMGQCHRLFPRRRGISSRLCVSALTRAQTYSLSFHDSIVDTFQDIPTIPEDNTSSRTQKFAGFSKLYICTGAVPVSTLSWQPHVLPGGGTAPPVVLDLDTCLDPSKLCAAVGGKDTVVVVGSSHSAILILKNLAEMPGASRPRIINFFIVCVYICARGLMLLS